METAHKGSGSEIDKKTYTLRFTSQIQAYKLNLKVISIKTIGGGARYLYVCLKKIHKYLYLCNNPSIDEIYQFM